MTEPITEPTGEPSDPATGTDGQAGDGDQPLGDKGQRALDAMKEERRDLKDRLKPWAELGVTPDQVRELLSQQEGAAERERERQLTQAAVGKANERLVRAEVRAAATGKLADPADALRFLDLSQVEVSDDGEVDAAAIAEQIDTLVASKPYLAAAATPPPRFAGGADGGPRKGEEPSLAQQIETARKSGNFAEVIRLESLKLTT